MRKLTFRTRLRLLILLTLLLIALTTFAVGKYITTISVHNTVTFTAELAEDVVLVESKITRKADGTYETTAETVTSGTQEYILIPGLDVPKDPRVVITGKTSIPAYLYIEIVDHTHNSALRYELTDSWITPAAKDPEHSGTVYVFSTDKAKPAKITSNPGEIYILKDNLFYVDQALLSDVGANSLTFYAYLIEATD